MLTRRKLLAGLGAVGVGTLAAQAEAASKDPSTAADETYFPNCELTTHEGKRVKFYDDLIRDRLVVLNFMFAHCQGTCPTTTQTLKQVQQLLGGRVGKDIHFYSISLLPEQDTPAALKDYVEQFGIDDAGWKFLTGKREDINLLRYKLGYYDPDPEVDANVLSHTAVLRLGNDTYKRWIMTPAAFPPHAIISSLMHLDRNHRGRVDIRPLSSTKTA